MKNNTMLISTLSIEGEESWGAKAMFASQHAGRDVTPFPCRASGFAPACCYALVVGNL